MFEFLLRFLDSARSANAKDGKESPAQASLPLPSSPEKKGRGEGDRVSAAEREKSAQKKDVVHLLEAAAVAANEAATVNEALQICLDQVCGYTGWPVGHVFFSAEDGSGDMVTSKLWHLRDPERFATFRAVTEAIRLASGTGLPGQVKASGKPVWITNVIKDLNFPRKHHARDIGVQAAFGFPVLVGKEVAAVLEFFTEKVILPDAELLETMEQIGTQLGRVIERERSRAALAEERERSRLIVETAYDAFIGINDQGRITDWNRQAERTFGWSKQEVLGQLLTENIIPAAFREAHMEGLRAYLATGHGPVFNQRLELAALHRDGHEFPIELTIWPVSIGQCRQFYAFVHDITERKRTEAILAAQAAQIQAVLNATADGIITINDRGIVKSMNGSAERLFGYRAEEVVGQNVKLLMPAPYRAEHDGYLGNYLRTGVAKIIGREREVEGLRKDGTKFPMALRVTELHHGDERVFIGTAQDITERHRTAAALRDLNLSLEQRVAERTAALEQRSQDLARSNADLEQFAYVASHDLQEPLRMVSSYTQLLARRFEGQLDKDANEFIRFAVDGATRMQNLINDLLVYARVGTRPKDLEPTDCLEVFNIVLTNLTIAITDSAAEVTHGALPTVLGDPVQLAQLFQNLVGNAIKFRVKNQIPRVHVEAEPKDGSWLFSVRDNGIGINPAYADRIFVIFKRLHTKNEYPGSGIGLSVCKKIVERHGGRIWVESEPGKGAVFYFTLPVKSLR